MAESSGAVNGKNMQVWVDGAQLADVTEFQINRSAKVGQFATSSTAGYTEALAGNISWTAQFTVALPSGDHDVGPEEGASITFKGVATTGKELEGTAIVESISYTVSQDEPGPILATVSCIGSGTYTK